MPLRSAPLSPHSFCAPKTPLVGAWLKKFFNWFNNTFRNATSAYVRVCGFLIRKSAFALILLVIFGAAAGLFQFQSPFQLPSR